MKIAIISDIHSNLLALSLAVSDIKEKNIQKYIFLGDYITDSGEVNEVLEIVKKKANWVILGNREKYILKYNPEKKLYNDYKPIANTYKTLTKDNLNYLKSLKEYEIIKINNYKILLIHGDNLIKRKDIHNCFDKIIENFDFDICLFGHIHYFYEEEYRNKIFINPGSLGQPLDTPTYKYVILDITDKIKVTLREFKTIDTFKDLEAKYRKSSYYKENKIWSSLILESIKNGQDYMYPFLSLFRKKIALIDNISVKEFNKIWNDTYKEIK